MNESKQIIVFSALFCAAVCAILLFHFRKKPAREKKCHILSPNAFAASSVRRDGSIFVSIASFRDRMCPCTVRDLFSTADDRARVFVGICQQNEASDSECLALEKIDGNVRIIRVDASAAKGPAYARYLCASLWDGQEYFMQIDSHTKFVRGWDTNLRNELLQASARSGTPPEKTIITHYPRDFSKPDFFKESPDPVHADGKVSHICEVIRNENGIPTFMPHFVDRKEPGARRSLVVAGGMFFAKSDFLRETPFDPSLEYIFNGEEFLFSARLWTRGYDFYTPSVDVVYHFYTRPNEPRFFSPDKNAKVNKRVIQMLKEANEGDFCFGKTRKLESYLSFLGVRRFDDLYSTTRINLCN